MILLRALAFSVLCILTSLVRATELPYATSILGLVNAAQEKPTSSYWWRQASCPNLSTLQLDCVRKNFA